MKKTILTSLLALLIAGCATPPQPSCPACQPAYKCPAQHGSWSQVVINNTGFLLDVTQDGTVIARNLGPGQTIGLAQRWFVSRSVVTVVAHDSTGNYIGADNWTFLTGVAEVWQVNEVRRPQERP